MTTTRPRLSEAQWQRQITDLAELYSWRWCHFRPAQTAHGWRTPVSGPLGAGWVDLVLVRERTVFVELKTDRGRLSEAQVAVREALRDAGAEYRLWRPRDWPEVQDVLGERAA